MKLTRCPICHTDLHLDALIEDDAGRELLALISQLPAGCARALVAYIGLFRPAKSNLSSSRALKLAQEVIEQHKPSRVLTHALSETVERIRAKRANGDKKPLSNHAYLREVYTTSEQTFAQTSTVKARERQQSESSSDSADAYFEQMQRMNVDVSTLHGGADWLAKRGAHEQ